MGEISTIDLTLPAGPVTNNDGKPFPHSMEPQLRKLGLATRMVSGVPSLATEHVVCRKGSQLTSEQVCRLTPTHFIYTPFLWNHLSRLNC
jgi:mRNA turnover protein 4